MLNLRLTCLIHAELALNMLNSRLTCLTWLTHLIHKCSTCLILRFSYENPVYSCTVHHSLCTYICVMLITTKLHLLHVNCVKHTIEVLKRKFKKIQDNSFILTFIGRIFVRIELVLDKIVLQMTQTTPFAILLNQIKMGLELICLSSLYCSIRA